MVAVRYIAPLLALVGCGPGVDRVLTLEPPFEAVAIVPSDTNVLARTLEVALDGSHALTIDCTPDDDADEGHRWTEPAASRHSVFVAGLLAETRYSCTLTAGVGEAVLELTTDALPASIPALSVEASGTPFGQWTLFNTWRAGGGRDREHTLLIVDAQGRVRWYHVLDEAPQAGLQVIPRGDDLLYAGGMGVFPTQRSLDGTLQWIADPADSGSYYHHDVRDLGDGVLALTHTTNQANGVSWDGFALEDHGTDGTIRWTWSSQQAVDAGVLPALVAGDADLYHANAISPDGVERRPRPIEASRPSCWPTPRRPQST